MFNRYWRTYPWYFQFLQLILLIAILFFFFVTGIGVVLIPWLTGVKLTDIASLSDQSPYAVVQAALIAQVLFSVSIFLASSLLFAYATHPSPAAYLGLRKPGKPVHWLIVPFLVVGLVPVLIQIGSWMSLLPWGADVRAAQEQQEALTMALIKMSSFTDLLKVFFVVAILPAFGEEMLFRGIFMKFAAKRSRSMVLPIVISAIMFAFVHENAYGFVSIFIAGVTLGLIYYLTGSLWCSILAHCINNGLQVVLLYLGHSNKAMEDLFANDKVPTWMFITGVVMTIAGFYLLWKNRTPLPADWSSDYTAEELKEDFDI